MKHRALKGLNVGERRYEPGDLISGLPAASIRWLLDDGAIEVVDVATGGVVKGPVEAIIGEAGLEEIRPPAEEAS